MIIPEFVADDCLTKTIMAEIKGKALRWSFSALEDRTLPG